MDLFTAIDSRASAIKVVEPGPTREDLVRIMQAGARAPDHGRLTPWRFVVLEGEARDQLGNAMVDAARAANPEISDVMLQREREKVRRAPTIIVAAATIKKGHKVPEIEQVLAVAAAVQNMFLAAHALGYGAMWKTGEAAYDENVKRAIGLSAEDHIVAFLYLGTVATKGPVKPSSIDNLVRWL